MTAVVVPVATCDSAAAVLALEAWLSEHEGAGARDQRTVARGAASAGQGARVPAARPPQRVRFAAPAARKGRCADAEKRGALVTKQPQTAVGHDEGFAFAEINFSSVCVGRRA